MPYIQEFFIIVVVHFLAVASPGPDFAIVLKQSIVHGRQTALYTSVGIGTGILVHVTYSLIGVGILIASSPLLFSILKYIAAGYLCYVAWHGIRAKKPESSNQSKNENKSTQPFNIAPTAKKAFTTGFLINALNVKATLFFVSVFTMLISPTTPMEIKLGYGLYMAIATALWFSFLSMVLTHQRIRQLLVTKGYWIDRIMGVILILLAVEIILSDLT